MSIPLAELMKQYDYGVTPCCGAQIRGEPGNANPKYPVCFNAGNRVVQCHHCGTIYEPVRSGISKTLNSIARRDRPRSIEKFSRIPVDQPPGPRRSAMLYENIDASQINIARLMGTLFQVSGIEPPFASGYIRRTRINPDNNEQTQT